MFLGWKTWVEPEPIEHNRTSTKIVPFFVAPVSEPEFGQDLGAFHTIERQEGAKAGGLPASHLSKSIPRILASVKLTEGGRKVGPMKFLKQWKLIEAP